MKAVLDHIGIAVRDVAQALDFYRDALGLEVEAPEEVASQRVRAHFLPVGDPKLELLEPTAPDSTIAKYVEKRGPGLHHITLRVDDIAAALARLAERGVRLIDAHARPGAEGAMVAFIHPASAHGVLVELKQAPAAARDSAVYRHAVGDLEVISLCDGFFRVDGGAIFGVVPRSVWEHKAKPDDRNRVVLSMRPLLVRGTRTMLIDAGMGDKNDERFADMYGVDRSRCLDQTLAEAGVTPEEIDVVLATHLHFDHAGGFTVRDGAGRVRPRFPRARYVVRRGEWEDASRPSARSRASYVADDFMPLADAGVLELVDDDQTIMPGVKVRLAPGHTRHHQVVWIESNGATALFAADLVPSASHLADAWIAGVDLYPMDTLATKQELLREAVTKRALVFLEHDVTRHAGRIVEQNGKRILERIS